MIGDHSDLPLFRHCERIGNQKYIDNTTTLWSLGKKYTYRDALIHYPIPSNSISTSALSASSSSEIHNQTNSNSTQSNSTQSTPVSIDSEQSRKRRLVSLNRILLNNNHTVKTPAIAESKSNGQPKLVSRKATPNLIQKLGKNS
jgi:hypothetical protein